MKKTKIYCEDFHLGHLMGGVCSFACFRTLPSTAAVIVMQYFFKHCAVFSNIRSLLLSRKHGWTVYIYSDLYTTLVVVIPPDDLPRVNAGLMSGIE